MTNSQNNPQLTVRILQLFSLIPLLLGLLLLLLGAQMSSLNCQRIAPKEGSCELTQVYLIWKKSQRWQLSDIQSIEMINQKRQLRLQTINREIQLMPYYASLGRTAIAHQQLRVNQMTRFFTDDQESILAIREDMRVANVPAGIAFIVLGLAALLDAQRRTSKSNT
jgi:hypothetical protein